MTSPAPVPQGVTTVTQTTTTVKVGNPAFRYLLGTILLVFSMAIAGLAVYEKETLNYVLGAFVLVPMVFSIAFFSETVFTSVVATLKPFVPKWGGDR